MIHQSLVFLKYLRMVFTNFQCASPGSDWYLLTTPSECATFGLVHVIAYMIEPTAKAYGILLMCSLSLGVVAQSFLEREIPWPIGRQPFLEFSMLNRFSTVSMYIDWDNPKSFVDLSLQILIPRMQEASPRSFMENCDDSQIFIFYNAGTSFLIKRMSSTYNTKNTTTGQLAHL